GPRTRDRTPEGRLRKGEPSGQSVDLSVGSVEAFEGVVVSSSSSSTPPSRIPFLNSEEERPSERARSGSFLAPNRSRTTAPTISHSVGPGIASAFRLSRASSVGLRREERAVCRPLSGGPPASILGGEALPL